MRRFLWAASALPLAAIFAFPSLAWSQGEGNGAALFGAPPVTYVDQPGNAPLPPPEADNELQELRERLQSTEQQLEMLRMEVHSKTQPPRSADDYRTPLPPATPPPATDGGWTKVPTLSSPTLKMGGFFHLDTGAYQQDAGSQATYGDMQDGTGFRRARMQATGKLSEQTNYCFEMDFATAGRPSFMDVWVEQTSLPLLGTLRIGHYRQPFSMDSLTSIRQLEFLERSLPFQAFLPFRRVGAMAYDMTENQMTTWAYGVYRTGGFGNNFNGDSRFATDITDSGGYSFSTRGTHLLYYDEPSNGRYLTHIGGSYDFSEMSNQFYQARAIPEFFVGYPDGANNGGVGGVTAAGTPFIADTGRLAAYNAQIVGVEFAQQYGPLHWQAEYIGTSVNQVANPTLWYDGAYVQGGWFITGESRTYNRQFGVMDRLIPFTDFFSVKNGICGWGAWEVCARYSYLDLTAPGAAPIAFSAGPPASPNPGIVNSATLGLSWWWNQYTRIQFNYIRCDVNSQLFADSVTDIYAARLQMEY
jgi:phosphate-selective porin OprO/OprP